MARQVEQAKSLRSRIPHWSTDISPLLPVAMGMGLAIFAVCAPGLTEVGGWGILFAVCASGGFLFFFDRASRRRLAAGLAIGAVLAGLHLWRPWQSYRQLVGRTAAGRVSAIVTDPFADPGPWGPGGGRHRVAARLRAVQLVGDDTSRTTRGKILLVMPIDLELRYGDRVEATGIFEPPSSPTIEGQFNYRRYLQTLGVSHLFVVETVELLDQPSPARKMVGGLFTFRGWLAEALVEGMKNEEHARAAAAMVLGYRKALDPATRRIFLRSGALHIFAISGLHVGIAMAVLLVGMRLFAVPFTRRYWVLPVVLGAYVCLTGASPSAVRAWTMIAAISLSSATLRPHSPLNGISLAAIALLAWNPLNLFNLGFQFSFAIVATLILGWRLLGAATEICTEKTRWTTGDTFGRRGARRLKIGSGRLLAHGALAWLGGAGLVAWSNSLFIPAALWVNLFVAFLALFALSFAVAKLIVACLGLSMVGVLLAKPLEFTLALIRILVETAADSRGCIAIARPWWGLVAVYYILLLIFLAPQSGRRLRLAALAALAVNLGVLWGIGAARRPGGVTLVHGDGARNLACIVEHPTAPPLTIFSGNYQVDMATLDILRLRGYDTIGAALLPITGRWADLHGQRILETIDAERVVVAPGTTFDWQALHAGRDRPKPQVTSLGPTAEVVAGDHPSANLAIDRFSPREIDLTMLYAEGRSVAVSFANVASASHRVEIDWSSAAPFKTVLPASQRVQIREWPTRRRK